MIAHAILEVDFHKRGEGKRRNDNGCCWIFERISRGANFTQLKISHSFSKLRYHRIKKKREKEACKNFLANWTIDMTSASAKSLPGMPKNHAINQHVPGDSGMRMHLREVVF